MYYIYKYILIIIIFLYIFLHSGNACRSIVRRYLKKKFSTIEAAEEAYGICYFGAKVN